MANLLNKFIMTRILAAITLLLSIVLTILVTIFCSVPIIIAGIVKLLLPVPVIWRKVSRFCDFMMYCWCEGLAVCIHLNPHLQWEVHGLEGLSKKNWYLLICNHRSWADIVVLCVLFRKHIPMNKYFLKQQLASGAISWPGVLGTGYAVYEAGFSALIYYVIRSDVVKMLKPLGVLVKSFACIPPPLSISLKAPVSRKKNISKPTPLFKTCCHQRRQALRWR